MPVVRIEHKVPNFDTWKRVFDSDPANRRGSGVRRYQVSRLQNDPDYVLIDLEFDTTAEAEAFMQAMQRIWDGPGKAVMQNPRARIVDVVETKEL